MPLMATRLPRAIILDLDDTILDSGDPDVSWRRVCAEFAGDFGVAPARFFDALIDARDWFWESDRRVREGRLDLLRARRAIFKKALSSLGASDPAPPLVDAMARRYTLLRDQAVRPFPGAVATLERLREAGIRLALLTNGSAKTQWEKIRRFGLAGLFAPARLAQGRPVAAPPRRRENATPMRDGSPLASHGRVRRRAQQF